MDETTLTNDPAQQPEEIIAETAETTITESGDPDAGKTLYEGNMVLRTENLVKKYGKRTVANHVSINVTQGEIVGLLGPNGAGKTTTFYMTVGLITPNEGEIYLNDLNITKYPVYKRAQNGIGYLAQEPSVFRKLSVENNIRAVLEMTNTSKEYQQEKLESLISEFRLQKVRKNLGDQLSGGERRPYRGRGYTICGVSPEGEKYRHPHHRPQRTGDTAYHRPRLSALRGQDTISRHFGRTC